MEKRRRDEELEAEAMEMHKRRRVEELEQQQRRLGGRRLMHGSTSHNCFSLNLVQAVYGSMQMVTCFLFLKFHIFGGN